MKVVPIVIILILIAICTFAQGRPELSQIRNRPRLSSEVSKIDSLADIADSFNLQANLPHHALSLAQNALILSKRIQYDSGLVGALNIKGIAYLLLAQYDSAIDCFTEAIAICKKSHLGKQHLASLYSFKGIAYFYLADYDSAALSVYKAMDLLAQNKLRSVTVYTNLSAFWLHMNEAKNALYYQQKIEKIARDSKDTALLIKAYTIRGFIYSQRQEDTDSVIYYERTDSAIYYFQLVIGLSKPNKNRAAMDAIHGIGSIYFDRGDYARAITYYHKSLEMPKALDATGTDVFLLYRLGVSYLRLKNYAMAERMLSRSLELMKLSHEGKGAADIYRSLSDLYNAKGDYAKAYQYLKISVESDSLSPAKETQKIINELEIKYQSAEKDKMLAQRQSKIQEQKIKLREKSLWFVSVSIVFLLIVVLFVVIYINSKHRHKIQEATINGLLQQQQINQLKAQMDGENNERKRIAQELHDGICNMISAAIMHLDTSVEAYKPDGSTEEHSKGLKLLHAAYEELRHTSHNLYPEKLLNHGLVAALSYYCKIISKPPALNVYYQVLGNPQTIIPEKALSMYRIIQESLHNAIKHGKATEIIVQTVFDKSGEISMIIEDNGNGSINDAKIGLSTGIGMYSLQQRIDALGGRININSQAGIGTTISISFDYIAMVEHG